MSLVYGTFDSNSGKYCFNGKWYQPRWYANAIKNRNWVDIYNICIEGYDTPIGKNLANWPKAVLVCCNLAGSLNLWDQIAKSYPGLYAQSQLHYYDASVPAGHVPDWALPWQQSGYLLIHEYEPGKVVWMREGNFEEDIYIFMVDTDAPATGSTSGNTSSGTGSTGTTTTTTMVSSDGANVKAYVEALALMEDRGYITLDEAKSMLIAKGIKKSS